MSRASSLARVLGADGALAAGDVSGLGALAPLNTVGASQIDDGAITAAKIASGAISETTYRATNKNYKFSFTNEPPSFQPYLTSFTLNEAEAPLGSLVVLSVEVYSGNSAGDQYLYLFQRAGASVGSASIYAHVEGWYYYESKIGLFYINSADDRTFSIAHGTIEPSTTGDYRHVAYQGYIKVKQ